MSCKRVTARINVSAIRENIKNLYRHMPTPKPIMAVVKADAYGHGAVAISVQIEDMMEIYGFATATAEEALELRSAGITKPILVLSYVFEDDYEKLIENEICLTLFDINSAKKLSDAANRINKIAKVHLKVDTGMSRIGVKANEEGLVIAQTINDIDGIEVLGIYTHLARADELDTTSSEKQITIFKNFIDKLNEKGIKPEIVHCANSASILQLPSAQLSIVRAGIVIYGLWPSEEMMCVDIQLIPALSLISHIVHIKEIDIGTQVSYGGTYISQEVRRIATIPVGYADGYPRSLSNKGFVLINGKKAPIVGRICMDQMMVDVTEIQANLLDEVILIGSSLSESITVEELGKLSGRFNYELVCDISPRVIKEYC